MKKYRVNLNVFLENYVKYLYLSTKKQHIFYELNLKKIIHKVVMLKVGKSCIKTEELKNWKEK